MKLFNAFTFKGGIHPNDNKERTRSLMIEDLPAPETLIFPVSQHIGAPAEPVVTVGEQVAVGQLIAQATGFVSAHVHSSVSGVVKAIAPMLHPNGTKVMSIVIENDFKDTLFEHAKNRKLEQVAADEIPTITRNAGIVGMGGATFPTHVKLSPPKDKRIRTIIINGAECEPYLTSDHRVMLEEPEIIVFGAHCMMKALTVREAFIAIEENKPDAIETISSLLINADIKDIKIAVLKTKYPQGAEKQLINAITKKEVPPGGLPADIGVIVDNIDTCAAIGRAVKTGLPLTTRVVTVGGGAIANHRNFRVRIGTPIAKLIEAVGGYKETPGKVILGGPMMGTSLFSAEVPVIKGTGAVLALSKQETYISKPSPCLRCGECVTICPMRLEPLLLNAYALNEDLDECERLNIMDCVECGSCTYICPGRRNPVQSIRVAKSLIRARKK